MTRPGPPTSSPSAASDTACPLRATRESARHRLKGYGTGCDLRAVAGRQVSRRLTGGERPRDPHGVQARSRSTGVRARSCSTACSTTESDLDLEEHYTDTHGYTEINFAAFVMVGMCFCPRIRSLHRQRIYCVDPARDHGVLEPVLQRGRRAVNFRLIAEQWDRIGQFYAAFPAGHASASAALQGGSTASRRRTASTPSTASSAAR